MNKHKNFATFAGQCALRAAVHEAAVTRKPGLVCADSQGAHTDMDITTLLHSAVVLQPYFESAATLGIRSASAPTQHVFDALRPLGCEAERVMLEATQDVNTHKGLIFSMGLLCCAAGRLYAQKQPLRAANLCTTASHFVQGIVGRDFAHLLHHHAQPHTAGEHFFVYSGNAGIRQEAEVGFPHVLLGLECFRAAVPACSFNTAALTVLVHLMARVADTNVWHRGGQQGLDTVRQGAEKVVSLGLHSTAGQQALNELCEHCVQHHLSPGGCADILAAVLFIVFVEA